MTEPVLTEDEKSALLDGVSSGAVEVHSAAGQKYADVQPYEIGPHARIQKNSYPRLKVLNHQLASRVANYCSSVLNCEASIVADPVSIRSYGEHCGRFPDLSAVTTFEASPLEGRGLIVLESSAISELVEAFFGGAGNDAVTAASGSLSPGELAVCRLFSNAILSMMQEVWQPIIEIDAERKSTDIGTDLVEGIGDSDAVIGSRFEMSFGKVITAFSVLLPLAMIGPLIPVFDGQKRERDAVEDARWEKAIRARLPDALVEVQAVVGEAQMPLGDIAGLQVGDIIKIEDPRNALVVAGKVAILEGRFGVHAGCNAIEATTWIDTELASN
jgi:flagellar motor switch protein FliM